MGSSKKVTIGYKYYMDLHMGVCRGPVNEIVEIEADEKKILDHKKEATISASGVRYINKSGLFGGEKKEGGIQGNLTTMMGEATQVAGAALKGLVGEDTPAFRGVLSLFYSGLISSMTPYVKEWSFRIRRSTAGWFNNTPWYPEKCRIDLTKEEDGITYDIHAMNPAHIIYEVVTNPHWGGGHPVASIDDASFRAAADTLYDEGFGLCIKWSREDTVQQFIQIIVDHIGGNFYQDKFTGLFCLQLIRDNYVVSELPLYTMSTGLLSIESDEVTALSGTANEVIVNWVDPVTNDDRAYKERNIAAINADGFVNQLEYDYPGIPTVEIAARVAAREIKINSSAIKRFTLKMNRSAFNIQVGSVFRISSPLNGIENIVLRAGRVEDGTMDDGTIEVVAVQDIFGLPATALSSQQRSTWTIPSREALPVSHRLLREATYWEIVTGIDEYTVGTLDSTASIIQQLGTKPSDLSMSYTLATSADSFVTYQEDEGGEFCPSGVITAAISIGVVPVVVDLSGGRDLDFVVVGDAVQIGDEIFRVDSIASQTYTTITFTLARGCVDTIPTAHALGDRCFVIRDIVNTTFYTDGVTLRTKMLTQTTEETLAIGDAPYDSLTVDARQAKPYPPANVQYDGQYAPTSFVGVPLPISWARRNRITQADQMIAYNFADITPEVGQTYTVTARRSDTQAIVAELVGVDGTSADLYIPYSGDITLSVKAVRDGVDSLYSSEHTMSVLGAPYVIAYSTTQFTTSTSQTVDTPTGTEVGDLLVLCMFARSTVTPPSGWTLAVATDPFTDTSITQTLYVYTKVASAGDLGASSIWAQSDSLRMGTKMFTVRGPTTPSIVQSLTNFTNSGASSQTTASLVVGQPVSLVVAVGSQITAVTTAPNTFTTTPSSYTQITPSTSNDTTNQIRMGVAHTTLLSGETTSATFTTNAGGANYWGTIIMEIA